MAGEYTVAEGDLRMAEEQLLLWTSSYPSPEEDDELDEEESEVVEGIAASGKQISLSLSVSLCLAVSLPLCLPLSLALFLV